MTDAVKLGLSEQDREVEVAAGPRFLNSYDPSPGIGLITQGFVGRWLIKSMRIFFKKGPAVRDFFEGFGGLGPRSERCREIGDP